jgi:transposase
MEVATLLRGGEVNNICEMKRQGLSISRISQMTDLDRKTIRKYLNDPKVRPYGPRTPRKGVLNDYKPFLEQRLAAGVWNAVVLLRELRERGYTGGYTAIKDYVRPLRQEAEHVASRRFETPPGQQAQMDWGHLGRITYADATSQPLSAFVMTLGCSRAMFADVATDQKLPTLLAMHERAFAELGGVPEEILYDNMKTVVLQTLTQGVDERGEIRWNPGFIDFARYWGFQPILCRPHRPQTKGKVESGVKYVRRNFLCGRQADSVDDLQRQLTAWVWEVANQRTHGTTHQVVLEAWTQERASLQKASRPAYPLVYHEIRQVASDAYVTFRTNRYAVPWQAAGKQVCVQLEGQSVRILRDAQILATHILNPDKYQTIADAKMHAGMPFGSGRSRGKNQIAIVAGAPLVEQRSLEVYAQAGGCPAKECAA